jgi:hypothetical protein
MSSAPASSQIQTHNMGEYKIKVVPNYINTYQKSNEQKNIKNITNIKNIKNTKNTKTIITIITIKTIKNHKHINT